MAKPSIKGTIHYLIMDAGDGSASLRLFESQEALDLYLEKNEDVGDLSEGGGTLTQADMSDLMSVADVEAEFGDD